MARVLYRKSSGEGLAYSDNNKNWRSAITAGAARQEFDKYFVQALNPTAPDGLHPRDLSTPDAGPYRVLGFAKHYDSGSNTWRNATQLEIDGYAASEEADNEAKDVDVAIGLIQKGANFQGNRAQRKILKAILRKILIEIKQTNKKVNLLADKYRFIRQDIRNANGFADLQAKIEASVASSVTPESDKRWGNVPSNLDVDLVLSDIIADVVANQIKVDD